MGLTVGQTLSCYEILGPLGAGGMGEVYRARDTRLEREVAIKVLPEAFVEDEERLRRFEREAKALASLNHSNVAQIHGMDQVGDSCFLVLELVQGENLAQRLARGPLPVDGAIDVCRQIAEGLEAAHEAGVVHRDLKPANVHLTPDGVVKVLDFGLAKAMPRQAEGSDTTVEPESFPTTRAGQILGTPTYMSPEQASGTQVDRRADIWAFGCVLFECLTGRRAFEGESLPATLAAILKSEPDWSALPSSTPTALRDVLARSLRKDPRRRTRDIGDVRIALEDCAAGLDEEAPAAARGGTPLVPILATTTVVAAAAALFAWSRTAAPRPELVSRPITSSIGWEVSPSWSPESELIAFGRMTKGSLDIYVKPVAGGEAVLRVESSGDEVVPRWSPDGKYLAFVSSGEPDAPLSLAPPHGRGSRRLIATNLHPLDFVSLNSCMGDRPWAPDATSILVSRVGTGGRTGVHRVDRETGRAEEITFPPPGAHDFSASSSFDGERIVFERRIHGRGTLWTLPWEGGDPDELLVDPFDNRGPAWRPDGRRVVFRSNRGGLYANLWELEVETGALRQLTFETKSVWAFGLSADDRIAYSPHWHDTFLFSIDVRGGEQRQHTSHTGDNFGPRFSPDGGTIAYHSTRTGDSEVWLHDVASGEETRLTDHPDSDLYPDWSPDGERLLFASDREGDYRIFTMSADGGEIARVVEQPLGVLGANPLNANMVARWSPDGERIAYVVSGEEGNALWTVRPDGGDARQVLDRVYSFDWYLDSCRGVASRQVELGGGMVLSAIDLATGREEILFEGSHTEIDVAPDGSAVAFCTGPSHLGMKLHVLALEPASGPEDLPRAAGEPLALYPLEQRWHVHNGGWSPDSTRLVFTHDTDYGEIYELVESR